jgi:hypothetical protein
MTYRLPCMMARGLSSPASLDRVTREDVLAPSKTISAHVLCQDKGLLRRVGGWESGVWGMGV